MPVSSASQCQSTFGMNGMEWKFAAGAPIPVNPKAPPQHNNTIPITGNISVTIARITHSNVPKPRLA